MVESIACSKVLPWHRESWCQFNKLKTHLPHAILLFGEAGIGKTIFAENIGRSLLCTTPDQQGNACGCCLSCGWFSQSNHPDFRCVRPEAFDESSSDSEDANDAGMSKTVKPGKAASSEIKIDQIRALADFMNVSTHRHGKRVVLLYPAEALNRAAANALLKTLEEPPPETVFVLIANRLDRLLPTILSRCRKFALPMPSHEEAVLWLKEQGVEDAQRWLAEQGGAPLVALERAQSSENAVFEELFSMLAQPGIDNGLRAAEKLQKLPVPELVSTMQRWLYDLFSVKLAKRIRYYPKYRVELTALAAVADMSALMQVSKSVNERRAIAEHPLSAKLFIEDMLLEYSTVFPAKVDHG